MLASGQQNHAATQAHQILKRFDTIADNIKVFYSSKIPLCPNSHQTWINLLFLLQRLLMERENQYREHKSYKEAYDDLSNWLARARDKLPALKQQSLSEKLAIENALAPIQSLLNKQAQGELLVEQVTTTGRVAAASSSPQGQQVINNDIRAITENFHSLFKGNLWYFLDSSDGFLIKLKLVVL